MFGNNRQTPENQFIMLKLRFKSQALSELKSFIRHQEIEDKLCKKQVLGNKSFGPWNELDFYVDSRLIIVYYSQDLKNKTRLVESVAIDRKPIIF